MEATILELLRSHTRPQTAAELQHAIQQPLEGVRTALTSLVSRGLVRETVLCKASPQQLSLYRPAPNIPSLACAPGERQPQPQAQQQKKLHNLDTTPTVEDSLLIHHLHRYNETKDVAQILIGQMALIKNVRTADLYPKYGLDLHD